MTRLKQFGVSLEQWFHRRVPIWVTEYGQQTRPEYPGGVSYAQQAADAKVALRLAVANPYVEMFVWFILRDSTDQTWNSGLVSSNGVKKPAVAAFAAAAKGIDGQNQVVARGKFPTVQVDVPFLAYGARVGAIVGITYRVYDGKKLVAVEQPRSRVAANGTTSFVARFTPVRGRTYILKAIIGDKNGRVNTRTVSLTAE
jgi:hypothetical protein